MIAYREALVSEPVPKKPSKARSWGDRPRKQKPEPMSPEEARRQLGWDLVRERRDRER